MNFHSGRIIHPHQLKAGDTIGIVAPAGPFERDRFDRGIALIEEMGFATRFEEAIFSYKGYLAGDDGARAACFNAMVTDDRVQAIMSARGGYGSLRMLDGLDYGAIAAAAKPIIGFSDITALHRAIFLKTGLITIHGPMVTTLAQCDEASRLDWYRTLTQPLTAPLDLAGARALSPGTARGILTGGNLATLCHLTGTAAGTGFKGCILMLEEVGEALYRIDRMLTQMRLAGLFEGLAGLILGSFENCGPIDDIEALVVEIFDSWNIPIVSGAPVGHGRSNRTVPLGLEVRLDASRCELVFAEPTFQE